MTKTLFAAALALTIITGSSFTRPPEPVNRNILSSFHQSYENAEEVRWETKKDFTKATFRLHGKVVFAYYKENGEEIARTRNMRVDELPAALRTNLRKKYSNNRWLTELFEVVSERENAYYASLRDSGKLIVYRADASGTWQEYSRKRVTE